MNPGPRRVVLVLLVILLAISVPVVVTGYRALDQASEAASYPEMAAHYLAAARRLPWRGDLHELAGHAYYHAGEYSLADAAYQRALDRGRLSSEGWLAWGDVNFLNGDEERGAAIWEQALGQDDPSARLYSRLAQVYEGRGEYARSAEYLQRYVPGFPEDAGARYRLGLLLSLLDPKEAVPELIDAASLDPQLDPAVQTLRTAINLASLTETNSGRLVVIGRGLALVGEWPLAQAAFEQAVGSDAQYAEAWAWLGEAKQQSDAEGVEELDRALDLSPDSAVVRGLRGLRFQRESNFRQALLEFEAAAQLEPENPAWQVSIGESHSKLGDLIRALKAYQAAVALAPDDPGYLRLLAIFCAQNNVNVKDVGIPAAQQAVVLAPADAASLDVLGWLLLLDGRHAEAERTLLRALELDPQNPAVHLHLGMVRLQTGERTPAFEHLSRARELGNEEAALLLEQFFP